MKTILFFHRFYLFVSDRERVRERLGVGGGAEGEAVSLLSSLEATRGSIPRSGDHDLS